MAEGSGLTMHEVYQNGRREMKLTVGYAISPLIKHERRSLSEMEAYANTLTREQLVTLAMAMQHLVNNIISEIEKVS